MPSADKLEWPQGEPLFETQWRAVAESLAGNGIVSTGDFELSAGTANREVTWTAGTVFYVGSEYSAAAGSTTVSVGDATYDRWDTVAFDTGTSSVVVHEGTPAANPEPPDISGGELLLGILKVPQNFDDVFTSSQILNWRAAFSNEAEEVHYDDNEGFWGASNVEAALDSANDLLVRRDYPTNAGAVVLTDMPVDGNAAVGTEESFTWAIDGTSLLKVYAESDGAGGIQATRVQAPNSNIRVGQEGVDAVRAFDAVRLASDGTNYLNRQVVYGDGDATWEHTDIDAGTVLNRLQMLVGGGFKIDNDLKAWDGTTLIDEANKTIPPARRNDMGTEDLTAESGSVTVFDNTDNHVPRSQIDDAKATTVLSSSTLTTSDEEAVLVDTATIAASSTVTLASADANAGNTIRVADLTGSASSYPITIETEGTETIDGLSSYEISSPYASVVLMSDGTNWVIISSQGASGRGPAQEDFSGAETGNVGASSQGILIVSSLDPDETAEVYRGVLTTATVEAVPTGVDLALVTFDNAGGFTTQSTIAAGDGSTIYDDLTGDPLASYTNGGTAAVSVGVIVNNTTTSGVNVVADVEGRTGL